MIRINYFLLARIDIFPQKPTDYILSILFSRFFSVQWLSMHEVGDEILNQWCVAYAIEDDLEYSEENIVCKVLITYLMIRQRLILSIILYLFEVKKNEPSSFFLKPVEIKSPIWAIVCNWLLWSKFKNTCRNFMSKSDRKSNFSYSSIYILWIFNLISKLNLIFA